MNTQFRQQQQAISEIQEFFQNSFPYLQIRFKDPEKVNKSGIHACCMPCLNDGNMKVHELQQIFSEKYGLQVLILRKSGKIWLETSLTGNWTLKRQNDRGRGISQSLLRQVQSNSNDNK